MISYYKMKPSIAQDYNDFGTDEGEAARLEFPTALDCGVEGTDFEDTDLAFLDCDLPEVTAPSILGSRHLRATPICAIDGMEGVA